jgi:DNA replication and repair protein RecF
VIVTSLLLADFRNYEHLTLEPHPNLTVLVGPNAVGKTNIIESLQLLTTATSFRRPRWEDLVRWGATGARAIMRAEEGERRLDVELTSDLDGARAFLVNGQPKRRAADVAGRLPSVVFTPDDLDLVKGPGERRRSAIDELGSQLSSGYATLRRDFGKVVKQRNALLREDGHTSELTAWDEQLVSLGARLVTHRLRLLERLMAEASRHYLDLTGTETLGWSYDDRCGLDMKTLPRDGRPVAPTTEEAAAALIAELVRRAPEERQRASTLVGPHRDDILFRIAERDARTFASQGQQRTVALAWKMAEVDLIEAVLRTRPLLLLDDVMSELDETRRAALGAAVMDRTQTFVTTTNIGYFDRSMLEDATVVELGR